MQIHTARAAGEPTGQTSTELEVIGGQKRSELVIDNRYRS
jgi:hypothetical protein